MTTIQTLASGSSGNAALISENGVRVLLDAGISCRRITCALQELNLTPADLAAVLITHTHADHICGLATIVKRWDLPIYASESAARGLAYRIAGIEPRLRPFAWGETLHLDGLEAVPFPTSHDAPGSAGYRFGTAGVLTDTGFVTEAAADALRGVALLMLEANHDVDRLRAGPYPYYLKARILGTEGHLSNDAAAAFAVAEARLGAREIVLAHLSAENNTPALALDTVTAALRAAGLTAQVQVAPRAALSVCYRTEGSPCSV